MTNKEIDIWWENIKDDPAPSFRDIILHYGWTMYGIDEQFCNKNSH